MDFKNNLNKEMSDSVEVAPNNGPSGSANR